MPADRFPMMPADRFPMMPADRYPMNGGGDRYPMNGAGDRYPMSPDRYPMMHYPPPRPGIDDTSKYPPPPNNRYPEDDRYGNRDPYATKDRFNPDSPQNPGMYPDTRAPPGRGQPERPGYGEPPPYSVRYPDGPNSKYPMMNPYGPSYPGSENRFPVGNDRFPVNIYKYGNRRPVMMPPAGGYPMMPPGYPDMGDRGGGYGQRGQARPPYAIMVGWQPEDNSISDTYGMHYGKLMTQLKFF